MRPMSDPSYVYRPWSAERRERASALARRRVGALPGHRLIYGVQVPDEAFERLSGAMQEIARKQGKVAAAAFLSDMEQKGWPSQPPERAWTPIEARRLREMLEAGLSAREIGKRLNRSRNSILGKVFRSGLGKRNMAAATEPVDFVPPPPGYHRVPAAMIWELARNHMESTGRDAEAAAFCIAPCFGVVSPKAISKYLRIPAARATAYGQRLRANGIWNADGPLDLERYMAEGAGAFLTLALDAMVCLDQVRRTVSADGEDLWSAV